MKKAATSGQFHELVSKLLTKIDVEEIDGGKIQSAIDAPDVTARKFVSWINGGMQQIHCCGITEPLDHRIARALMDRNFWGIEEWAIYGENFTEEQIQQVSKFPWSEEVLNGPCPFNKGKRVKETHFAFLGLRYFKGRPLTISRWKEIYPANGKPRFSSYPPGSYKFMKVTCDFQWYLMPLSIVPNPERESYEKQVAALPSEYEPSSAIAEVTKHILYYQRYSRYLKNPTIGQCRDSQYSNNTPHVSVGISGDTVKDGGIVADYYWGSGYEHFGLTVSRRFSS